MLIFATPNSLSRFNVAGEHLQGLHADEWRLGLNVQYVRGFFRTQRNHYLSIPHDELAEYPPRLRELLGYELYRGIMGHVDARARRLLLVSSRRPGRLMRIAQKTMCSVPQS
jgi:ectoine hydroxylase-related dioxygenase (phytanoyl-CoA dioxygenase family)